MFNRHGHDAVFYGPQEYHLDKCKGEPSAALVLRGDDILIGHYLELREHPLCRSAILSCHEKEAFPLRHKSVAGYDAVRFVSESQRNWQQYPGKSVVIPDNVCELQQVQITEDNRNTAGIIGTILPAKQTHISVSRALEDGVRVVRIYGSIGDRNYFDRMVKPLLSDRVIHQGHLDDKQAMYNSISCVYHSSASETFGLVKAECLKAGIPFCGTAECDISIDVLPDSTLFKLWNELLLLEG